MPNTLSYIDFVRLIDEKSPQFSTVTDYNGMVSASNNIIDNNLSIINKIQELIPAFIVYEGVSYDVNNLYSSGAFYFKEPSAGNNVVYFGMYHYNHDMKSFYIGNDRSDVNTYGYTVPANTELKYRQDNNIERIFKDSNFDFSSLLVEQKNAIETNYTQFKVAVNSISVNLNKKLNFAVGLQNAAVEYYSNFNELIHSNLKYFRTYNDVKKYSLRDEIVKINFTTAYLDFLESIVSYYESSDSQSLLIEDILKIDVSNVNSYNGFTKMVCSKFTSDIPNDVNFEINLAFRNINKKGVHKFIEDFSKVEDDELYNVFLMIAVVSSMHSTLSQIKNALSELYNKFVFYTIDNLYDTSSEPKGASAYNYLPRGAKQPFTNVVYRLSILLNAVSSLEELFRVNDEYNVFLDFFVRESSEFKVLHNIEEKAAEYLRSETTNGRVLKTLNEVYASDIVFPRVLSQTYKNKRREADHTFVSYTSTLYIEKEFISSLEVERIEFTYGPEFEAYPDNKTKHVQQAGQYSPFDLKWDSSQQNVWTLSYHVRLNHRTGRSIVTNIKYKWTDVNGKTGTLYKTYSEAGP